MSPREILSKLACCGIRPMHLYLDCYRHFKLPPEGPPVFASSLIHLEIQLENNHVAFVKIRVPVESRYGQTIRNKSAFVLVPLQTHSEPYYTNLVRYQRLASSQPELPLTALDSLVPYICALPHLESLRIRGLPDDIDDSIEPGTSLALPPRLHALHIAHPLISDWIISLDPVPKQITTLGLLHIHWNDWPGINRYLSSAAAEGVQSLIFIYGGRLRGNGPGPEFKDLRRLKHLSLYKLDTEGPKSLLGVLARLKSSPARRTLETITLSLRFVLGAERYSPAKWHAIDAELADRAMWPRLRSFTILADTETDPESDGGKNKTLEHTLAELSLSAHIDIPIALSIRTNLGQCDDLGILKIEGIPMVHPHEVPLRVEQGLSLWRSKCTFIRPQNFSVISDVPQ
ncbi:hypothetical protein MVEN_01453600 [Mycena venus]|uniref:Uncharacterized protein n=1 Tax=Mycena venus TaxID=2733690 RepID=A0A8H7CR12_9AGAR|nr:hypothetical protein MVEN_01453600 [Mycena venus]